ncbi:UMP kinase [Candidatus Peribacteria bacterium RIFCSPLOWO2_12_FULL_55_15]|nr:MAG: UMP kinase [Candidatus Peribacteria bacterium RIFCSPHIGHO2_01_FULL_54_22]OGJ62950.1 MAG: UMP kinase [Candidatus Peribacteria bacterium RIFCSPHIGHO2_02_FULL_55_24]OGJ64852.1 MAG: UMP kinase [Candidatus Peribacteria bacterium RIFCSPHIGHO2_12_FULL_54_10]OGJ69127.1 MAG: UMP kinase [Candidatus Peribacteria bacterium RIFCSPLOWO2_02_FULL_55_36]OGJ70776.1 MAG: UMP kinase [Candidatus Peribacteria bacterium RIFCSPLOWO2_12_FULL_55_15]
MTKPNHRILLKLSGEVFSKEGKGSGLHLRTLHTLAGHMKDVIHHDIQLVIVTGGGNIWRYRDNAASGIERTVSDYMGMLATIFNGVALQASLESIGVQTRVLSAIQIPQLAEPYIRRRALRHLEKGRVVICVGGTGNPFFTTDTTAALRASELSCNVLLKATNVNGIYDRDPKRHRNAKRYKELTYTEALEKHLDIMDQAAFSLCQDQRLPIRVFDFRKSGNLLKAALGEDVGTLVHD